MSDTTNNAAEKPVNDGGTGTSAPQQPSEPTDDSVSADTTVDQGGSSD